MGGAHLGMAFQLVDDVLDYAGEPSATGKTLLADLSEGKLTLPLIRALAARAALANDLPLARTGDVVAIARLVGGVAATGACNSVRDLARTETDAALAALTRLPASPARDLLAHIARDLAERLR
jgi:octaprenyl-diphosphate synthase